MSDIVNGTNIRLVGWGKWSDLRLAVLHRLFGEMVKRAMPVVKEYHGDLFIDAEWLAENVTGETTFQYLVRHSGTTVGPNAPYMASIHEYDFVLYGVTLFHDERDEWFCRFDVITEGKEREPEVSIVDDLGPGKKDGTSDLDLPSHDDDAAWGISAGIDEFDEGTVESVPEAPDAVNTQANTSGLPWPQANTWWDFETDAALSDCEFWDTSHHECAGPRVGIERRISSGGKYLWDVTGRTQCEKHVNSNPPK